MTKRSFITLPLLALLWAVPLSAQTDFSDVLGDDDPFAEANEEWDAFNLEAAQQYEDFRREANEQYAQFLEEAWKQFGAVTGKKRPADQNGLSLELINSAQRITPKQVAATKTPNARFNIKDAVSGIFESMRPDPAFKHKSVRKLLKEERRKRREAEKLAARQEKERFARERKEAKQQKLLAQQQAEQQESEQKAEKKAQQAERKHDQASHRQPEAKLVNFLFYGTPMQVNVGDITQRLQLKDTQPGSVAAAWRTCSGQEYNELLCDLMELREKYELCDWAYLQMLSEATAAYLGRGSNEATLLTAFVYCQSGYRIRLAQTDNHLLLLYACQNDIYDLDYYELDNSKFYIYNARPDNLYLSACEHGFEKEQSMSLFMDKVPTFSPNNSAVRTIRSTLYPEMEIKVSVNQNLIKFYESYPSSSVQNNFLTRWAMYANKPMEESVRQQIYPTLQKHLAGLSEVEAVSRLLSLLQSGLTYKYDEEVWGHDRAFFAEETLFYPYADCEDRAILFSRLVRDLLNLKVALIYYNSGEAHLAAAVRFNEKVEGDAFTIGGENYFVCDPTNCIPLPGVTMQAEVNAQAQLIVLN